MLRLEADGLIDGVAEHAQRPGRLCVKHGRVVAPDEAGPEFALSLPGCTLLPGLIDFHTHAGIDTRRGDLRGQARAPGPVAAAGAVGRLQDDLRAGVTTARLCGDIGGLDLRLRAQIEDGWIAGPRLFVAGQAIKSPHGGGGAIVSVTTDDPEEIGRVVDRNLADGVDLIKLFVSDGVGDPNREPTACYYDERHVAAAARRAHAAGRPVAAHLLGGPGVAAAIGGGLDVLEHGWFLTDADLDLIAQSDTLITLTLGILCGRHAHAFGNGSANRARLDRLGRDACEAARKVIARRLRYVLGTDAVHGRLADEVDWAVTLGETPMRAIRAVTAWPAAALGAGDRFGTLEHGKAADVIAVEGDPLADVRALDRVRMVMRNGRIVYHAGPGRTGVAAT